MGHWMAHELGHPEKNSADESDAEKAAAEYRRGLKTYADKQPKGKIDSYRDSFIAVRGHLRVPSGVLQ